MAFVLEAIKTTIACLLHQAIYAILYFISFSLSLILDQDNHEAHYQGFIRWRQSMGCKIRSKEDQPIQSWARSVRRPLFHSNLPLVFWQLLHAWIANRVYAIGNLQIPHQVPRRRNRFIQVCQNLQHGWIREFGPKSSRILPFIYVQQLLQTHWHQSS